MESLIDRIDFLFRHAHEHSSGSHTFLFLKQGHAPAEPAIPSRQPWFLKFEEGSVSIMISAAKLLDATARTAAETEHLHPPPNYYRLKQNKAHAQALVQSRFLIRH